MNEKKPEEGSWEQFVNLLGGAVLVFLGAWLIWQLIDWVVVHLFGGW